jgi:D-alanine-D-alanine ligase
MRITILAHPQAGAGETFGETVGQIAAVLRKGLHRVSILGVHCDIGRLISGLKRRQPDLIFNLMDPHPTAGPSASMIVGLLELLGLPYTGSGPGESFIQQDTAIAHTLLAVDGHPNGFTRANGHRNGNGKNGGAARPREFRVGLLGNDEPIAFPPVEVIGPSLTDHQARLGALARSNGCEVAAEIATHLDNGLREKMLEAARCTYRTLRVRDYGQVVLWLSGGGSINAAGVRTDCNLGPSGDFARAAEAAGLCFVELVNRVAELAMDRASQKTLTRLI